MSTSGPRFPRDEYEIVSPRLIIRTARESDAEGLLQYLQTPENFPYFPCEKDLTVEKLRGRVGRWKAMQPEGKNAFMVIILRQTGEVIGQGSYNCFEWTEPTAAAGDSGSEAKEKNLFTDLGVMLDHKHWRKGLGTEAYCSLMEFAIAELGCDLFRTETAAENEPWKATIRNLGLANVESFGPQSYDANVTGWVWKYDARDWQKAKAGLQEKGKWPM